ADEVDAEVHLLHADRHHRADHQQHGEHGRVRGQAHEVEVGLARDEVDEGPEAAALRPVADDLGSAHTLVLQAIGRVLARVTLNPQPISSWVTRIAEKTEVRTPIDSVQAKPFTGPAPNENMISAEIMVVTLASKIELMARR